MKFKNTATAKNSSIAADRKYSRTEVNTIIGKLKRKLEEETRELNAIVGDIDEPMEDDDFEALLNDVADQE